MLFGSFWLYAWMAFNNPLPGVQSPVGIRPLQQHGHFITADAGDHILVTETIFDQLGYVLQSQVAGLVAVLVVDFL